MLHAKFQDQRASVSGEEYLKGFLTYKGMEAIFVM